ncbi:sensor histidine kinase [Thermocatellispora tengchongensis]|uniref:sensor histidine kinase n=1 Tax=Thermocatellispora tengchongensis TaxID=1073253 RepID=UPI0036321EA0
MLKALRRLLRPLALAVATGRADPPAPRPRALVLRVPRSLGLLPFDRVDLVVLADLILAAILLAGGYVVLENANRVTEASLDWQGLYMAAAVNSLPLLLRDKWPLAAWRLAAVGIPIGTSVTGELLPIPFTAPGTITFTLALYSVAVRCDRSITLGVWAVSIAGAALLRPEGTLLAVLVVTVTVLLGYNVRIRRDATRLLADEEERTQIAMAARAVLEERARIARELHDVVAHHMSVIAIQAEAVPIRSAGDPAALEAGLAEIRGLSLAAMTEMRRVLGVLRDQDGRRDTAPQPGLERLGELVEQTRAAGLPVTVSAPDPPPALPAAVSLSAYRIVQESLSNVRRHAPGAAVTITIAHSPAALSLEIANTPPPRARPAHPPTTRAAPRATACWACASAPPCSAVRCAPARGATAGSR